ncbi:MAG TPA: 30S ribosomal protein S1 [Actinomycetota bacterium]|nr:30S ribosomal protein S1 [Actinomycetota bacterium]
MSTRTFNYDPAEPGTEPDHDSSITANDVGISHAELMAAIDATIKPFDEGDLVAGTVVKIDKDEVLVDIGFKSEGVIPAHELSIKQDVDPSRVVSVGDRVEALVLQKEDKEGRLILSKKRAQYERAWGNIEAIKQAGGIVKGPVIEVVKGGLIVDIGLRGFLPASLVELRRVRDLAPYVGRELECKIIELDKNRNNVVLSRRAYLEEAHSEQRKEFLENLKPGEIRTGTVSSIVNFGAFVDLGGVDGLVHVSELSWRHVDHPSEVVQVGQEISVEVLDVDLTRERVSLSLKNTQEDPWRAFARQNHPGDVVQGTVTKLVPFGAFVKVAEGIEGLVHISELAERHVELPEQVVSLGQEVSVKVIDVDLDRRRISLSMKQALGGQPAPASEIEREEASTPAPVQAGPDIAAEPDIAPEPSSPAPGSDAEVAAEPAPDEVVPEPAEAEPAAEEKPSEPEPTLEGELLASAVAQSGESLESILQEMKRDLER